MKKLVGISIAAAGIGFASIGFSALLNYLDSKHTLSQLLISLRDDLELDCDLINSTLAELPSEQTTEVERSFAQAINNAADFAASALNIYGFLSEETIKSYSSQTKKAYITCLRTLIRNAERHIMLIDEIRYQLEGKTPENDVEVQET